MNKILYKKEDISLHLKYVIETTFQYMSTKENAVQDIQELKKVFEDECQRKLFDILAHHLMKSEISSPNSSDIFINLLRFPPKKGRVKVFTKRDVTKLFQSITSNREISEIAEKAVLLSGFRGKISVGASPTNSSLLELKKGICFEGLKSSFSFKESSLKDAKIICIDGFIESVSEIHHLLDKLSNSKIPAILFVRGLSEEVVHTLKVNFDRKTVICVPVIVPYDIDGVNILNDIAVISKNDIVSSLKGDLISSINIENFNEVEEIQFSKNEVVILAKGNNSNIDRHINYLQHKILNAENDATVESLTKRIKRLGTNQVRVLLAEDINIKSKLLSLDKCIRSIKFASSYGIFDSNGKIYLNSSMESAKFYLDKFKKTVEDIGCILNNVR